MSNLEHIEDMLENGNVDEYELEDTYETKDGKVYAVKITYERIE